LPFILKQTACVVKLHYITVNTARTQIEASFSTGCARTTERPR